MPNKSSIPGARPASPGYESAKQIRRPSTTKDIAHLLNRDLMEGEEPFLAAGVEFGPQIRYGPSQQ
jgi:hypothetical protein